MSWFTAAATMPYGAFELKATYQRNMFWATFAVLIFTGGVVVVTSLVLSLQDLPISPPPPDIIRITPLPPPTVIPNSTPAQPKPPAPPVCHGTIPVAVPADSAIDEESQVPTQNELRNLVGSGPDTGSGPLSLVVPDSEFNRDTTDRFPGETEFVPVEKNPEFVHKAKPVYPEAARRIGLSGSVILHVLVDKEGKVREAKVWRSSGFDSLDFAAVQSAYQCLFTPAIQNGRPVAVWVAYTVEFALND